ncbi:hypothetical protein JS562_53795 [Agrobacterium sp. S2]|nr:hypothetical protein [Agrobacterium sp. S2]
MPEPVDVGGLGRGEDLLGFAVVEQQLWPIYSILDGVKDQPVVYSFLSCTLRQAGDRTGISESALSITIAEGWLTAHRSPLIA